MNGLTCLGAGTFPLDNLLMKHADGSVETIYQHVGGTAGNVMSILAWMGWHTLPAARLDDSEVGLQLKVDLESYGCDTCYLTNTPDGGTTILDIIHKTGRDGRPKTAYMAHSPRGGRFVNHRFWTLKQAQALFDSLDEMPEIFFFDRCAPGNILLAELFHKRGVLVYYEPNEPVDRNFLRAVAASDIVKFSNEKHPDVSFTDGFTVNIIQTLWMVKVLATGQLLLSSTRWDTTTCSASTRFTNLTSTTVWKRRSGWRRKAFHIWVQRD